MLNNHKTNESTKLMMLSFFSAPKVACPVKAKLFPYRLKKI